MKYYGAHRGKPAEHRICPHCAAKNPAKAYVCLKCFKVMNPQEKFSLLNLHLPPSIIVTVIVSALVLAGIHVTGKWLNSVEANVNIRITTAQYDVQVIADKKKQETLDPNITIEKIDPPQSPSL